ncbi:MAG: heavy-metal-associated domain-containing protein [Marinicaulis sp.]|nr:heavy-metal-associated domain-containing protein [Marinicaulis sp.]
MKRILIIIASLGAFAVIGAAYATMGSAKSAKEIAATMEESTQLFAIEKMTCATCPITVKKAMGKVDGVQSVDVDFEAKTATVVFDPSKTTPEQIADASTNAGYPARLIDA